jgi:hypothetical protein
MKIFYFLIALTLFYSCNKKPSINDDVRNNVLPKMNLQQDTLKIFGKLLDKLDEKNVKFGDYFLNTVQTIQDSCSKETDKKFNRNPSIDNMTTEMYEYNNKLTFEAIKKYDSTFNVSEKESSLATFIVVSYPVFAKYINDNFGLDLYIAN